MFKQLLRSLARPARADGAPATPAPAADPRVTRVLAAHAAAQARYAELAGPAGAPDAGVDLLMRFAEQCFHLELDTECEQSLLRVLALEPGNAHALYSLGLLYAGLGSYAEAQVRLRAAFAQAPHDRSVRFSLAMTLMCQGKFAEGFPLFDARLAGPGNAPQIAALPRWHGEPLGGRTLVLWCDWGGFGDDLGFLRFVRAVREAHPRARLLVAPLPGLGRLYAAQPYIDEVVKLSDTIQADVQCSLIDCFGVLSPAYDTLPAWPAYLRAPQADLDYWSGRWRGESRLKVGLVWTSTSIPQVDVGLIGRENKHPPAGLLAILAEVPNVVFVSLQKGAGITPLADLMPGAAVVDETADLGDFADTAALVSQLDLVITIDTAMAHLAGALGVPTLVLMRKGRAFFYPEHREDTPWYPSIRVLAQPQPRDWQTVFLRTREVLARRAAGTPWPRCFETG